MAEHVTISKSQFQVLFHEVEDRYVRERWIADQQQDVITGKLINKFLYDLESLKRHLQEG